MSCARASAGGRAAAVAARPRGRHARKAVHALGMHRGLRSIFTKTMAHSSRCCQRATVQTRRRTRARAPLLSARRHPVLVCHVARVAAVVPHRAPGLNTVAHRVPVQRAWRLARAGSVGDVRPGARHALEGVRAAVYIDCKPTACSALSTCDFRARFEAPALVDNRIRRSAARWWRGARMRGAAVARVDVAIGYAVTDHRAGDVDAFPLPLQAVFTCAIVVRTRRFPLPLARLCSSAPGVPGASQAQALRCDQRRRGGGHGPQASEGETQQEPHARHLL